MCACELKNEDLDPYWEGVIDGQHDLCLELLEHIGFSELTEGHEYINKPED